MLIWFASILMTFLTGVTSEEYIFLEQPFDQEVSENETIVINCQVNYQPTTVFWMINGIPFTRDNLPPRYSFVGNYSNGEYHLRIENINYRLDLGEFYCQPSVPYWINPIQRMNSRRGRLIARQPVEKPILFQDSHRLLEGSTVTAHAHDTISLICYLNQSSPRTRIKWFVGRESFRDITLFSQLQPNIKSSNGMRSFLEYNVEVQDNTKLITCQAEKPTDHVAVMTSAITLNVEFAPHISLIQEPPGDVEIGDHVKLICRVTANPPATAMWILKKRNVTVNNTQILLDPARTDHTDEYECIANNSFAEQVKESLKIDIKYPPRIISTSIDGVGLSGNNVTLHCRATGNPFPHYRWTQVRDDAIIYGASSSNYTFLIEEETEGSYKCAAYNTIKGVKRTHEMLIHVDILGVPEILPKYFPNKRFAFGTTEETLFVLVQYCSKPPPTERFWKWSNKKLLSGKAYDSRINSEIKDLHRRGCYEDQLIIKSAVKTDAGDYSFYVKNIYGSNSTLIQVQVLDEAPIGLILGLVFGILLAIIILQILILLGWKKRKHLFKRKNDIHPK